MQRLCFACSPISDGGLKYFSFIKIYLESPLLSGFLLLYALMFECLQMMQHGYLLIRMRRINCLDIYQTILDYTIIQCMKTFYMIAINFTGSLSLQRFSSKSRIFLYFPYFLTHPTHFGAELITINLGANFKIFFSILIYIISFDIVTRSF